MRIIRLISYLIVTIFLTVACSHQRNHFTQTENALNQLDNGGFPSATAAYKKALNQIKVVRDAEATEKATTDLAKTTLLAKDYTKAIPLWEKVIKNTRANGFGIEPAQTNLALALYHTHQYKRAENTLKKAILGWEKLRMDNSDLNQVTLFEQQAHSYRLLQKVLIAQGRVEDALVIAETSRAQSLVEQLIQQYNPNKPAQELTLQNIRQTAINQKTTIILYSLVGDEVRVLGTEENLPDRIYIWVIQPNGKIHLRVKNLHRYNIDSLRDLVNLTRNEVTQESNRKQKVDILLPGKTYLEKMYQLLIKPIESILPTDPHARVTIIPQDALFLVPFPALRDLNGAYLIQKHTLLNSPSIQVMNHFHKQNTPLDTSTQSPLIIGNPIMPVIPGLPDALEELPGTQIEAEAIAKLFNTRALVLSQASEQQVLAKIATAPIVHFATHGLLDIDSSLNVYGDVIDNNQPTARDNNVFVNPGGVVIGKNVFIGGVPAEIALSREKVMQVDLAGALALASTTGYDGFLTSREIAQLHLVANLVVLSACDTGQGRITGDGVVGLARSFMIAGANTVIVSLWAIPDAPTAELMVTFYQQLVKHGDKPRALREAMLKTQKDHPDPLNWGAFTLIGAPF
ncbi:MAG: CHAT domain-containing tetratricopeptide repeat protein [Methylococcales bacterium]